MSGLPEGIVPSFEHRSEADLPEGWAYAALGDLGAWSTGNTPSKSNANFWASGTVPWFSPKDMKISYLDDAIDHVTESAIAKGGAASIPTGTVLFVVRGMILAHTFPVALTTRPATFNQDMRAVVPIEAVHPPYLLRALQYDANRVLGAVREATHGTLRLESETLRRWPVPIAPLPEQRRIVVQVEALLADVNKAKERLDRVPLILKRFRQSVLAAACSGELTGNAREEEALPRGWRQVSPDEVASNTPNALAIGPFGSNLKVADYTSEGVPLVFVREIRAERFGGPNTKFVSTAKAEELRSHAVRGGDLLVTKMGEPPGDTSLYPYDRPAGIITADCIKLTPNADVALSAYLRLALRAEPARSQLLERAMGVAQQKLSLARFREIRFPLPPLAEQAEIVRRVNDLFALADAIERRVKVAKARADKLPQAILTKAFSGELVPTEAELARAEGRSYESAEELLARVRAQGATTGEAKAKKAPGRKKRVEAAEG